MLVPARKYEGVGDLIGLKRNLRPGSCGSALKNKGGDLSAGWTWHGRKRTTYSH